MPLKGSIGYLPPNPIFSSVTVSGLLTPTGGIAIPVPAPDGNRGALFKLSHTALIDLNAVAQTPLLTVPATVAECEILAITIHDFTGAPTTNAISFGRTGTPTDWLGSTVLNGGAGVGKAVRLFPGIGVPYAIFGPGDVFVANVTVGGAAITCSVHIWGCYA